MPVIPDLIGNLDPQVKPEDDKSIVNHPIYLHIATLR